MARLLPLGVAIALLAGGCGSAAELTAKALAKQSESLQSVAAEGALLAKDAAAGKTTRIFTREHSSDLYKAASQTASSLRTAKTEHALEPKLRRLASISSDVSADLKKLGDASEADQRSLARHLSKAAGESEQIGTALG